MAQAGVKHDYHLVNPSPYPLVGSIAATVMALGGVAWMKGLFGIPQHNPWLFFAGLAGVLYTMFGWWSEVVKEANRGDHTPVVSIGLPGAAAPAPRPPPGSSRPRDHDAAGPRRYPGPVTPTLPGGVP